MKASIVGNGVSRERLNLDAIEKPVFGCNNIIRDWKVDFVAVVDEEVLRLLQADGYVGPSLLYPKDFDETWEPADFNPNQPKMNAGMFAMKKAIEMGFDDLQCYGMDFLIENHGLFFRNMYEGMPGYEIERRCTYNDSLNRVLFMDWFASKNPNVKFTFWFPKGDFVFRKFTSKNIQGKWYNADIQLQE